MEASQKIRENRMRRKLDRMGYRLIKSRRKDPDAFDYGLFAIVDQNHNSLMHESLAGSIYALDLEEVDSWIEEQTKEN